MAGQFHAHSHPGVVKQNYMNVNNSSSELFYSQEFLGVPIIVANMH